MLALHRNLNGKSSIYNLKLLYIFFSLTYNLSALELDPDSTYFWYFEDQSPNVYKIHMLSDSTGYATSSGKGKNIDGHVLKYEGGNWKSVQNYSYSDFPALYVNQRMDKSQVFAIHHLTHNGDYQPIMRYYNGQDWSDLKLPQIMWDKKDFAMFFALNGNRYNNIWGVGQKGNIIRYKGHEWKKVESPLKWSSQQNYYEEDIFGISVISDTEAWACAYGGKILHFIDGAWKIDTVFSIMSDSRFYDIEFINENSGIAVGEKGALAIYKNGFWHMENLKEEWTFYSIKIFATDDYWMAGSDGKNAILLHEFKNELSIFESLNLLNIGSITDIDGFSSTRKYKLWLATPYGIVTNLAEETVTFTDVTSTANLPVRGRGGIFFDLDDDDDSDLMILSEGGVPYRGYKNDGRGQFSEFNFPAGIKPHYDLSGGLAIGDIDNDGRTEILLVGEKNQLLLLRQSKPMQFKTDISALPLIGISKNICSTVKFWDINTDGYVDIFYGNGSDGLNVVLNNGYGEFKQKLKLSIPCKADKKLLGISLYDVNVDGLTDILLVYNNDKNELWMNKNDFQFEHVAESVLAGSVGDDPFMGIFSDFNLDGNPDIFIYNRNIPSMIFNSMDSLNTDFSNRISLDKLYHYYWETGMISAGDINNDFFTDLYISNSLWINKDGRNFKNVSRKAQISFEGNSSMEDYDNDGDLDIFLGNLSQASGMSKNIFLFKNNFHKKESIKLKFDCYRNNKYGIGSWVWIYETSESNKKGELCASKYIGFEGSPLLGENFYPVTIPVKANRKYNLVVKFPDGRQLDYSSIIPGKTFIIYDMTGIDRLFSKIIWYVKFSIKKASMPLESIKVLIFVLAGLWLLFRFKYFSQLRKRWKWSIGVTLVILYLFHFIFTGLYSFSIKNLGIFSGLMMITTVIPYFSSLIIEKHRLQRISHFKILHLIGEGGMGKVFKARDTKHNREVALKILNPGVTDSEEGMKRFQRECQIGIEISHKNIVRFYETGEENGNCFLAMEYLEGQTLKQQIKEGVKFSENEIVKISMEILSALAEIHYNHIIHRDVKSENIFITQRDQVKLMDFGLAKSAIFTAATKTNEILGTLSYMSPQQAVGEIVDHRTDIYSVGVIMYEMATGKLPFSGTHDMAVIFEIFKNKPPSISEWRTGFSADVEKCIFKAMAKEVEDRYQNCDDFIADLQKLNDYN